MEIILKGNPISTNNCFFHMKAGFKIMTPKARALKETYKKQASKQYNRLPLTGFLEITIKLYFGTKRKYDWDNFHKLSMDALTGIVWVDDSQIQKATVEKFYDKENPRIVLEIKKYDNFQSL